MQFSSPTITQRFRASWVNAPKWQRIFIILTISIISLKIIFDRFTFTMAELKTVNQSIDHKTVLVKAMELESHNLINIEKQSRIAKTRLDSLSANLLDHADPAKFLLDSKEIEFLSVRPEPLVDYKDYQEFKFHIRFAAQFADLVTYLKHLENLDIPVVLRNIKLRAYNPDPSKMNVLMTLSTFLGNQVDSKSISLSGYPIGSEDLWQHSEVDKKAFIHFKKTKTGITGYKRANVMGTSRNVTKSRSYLKPTLKGLKITGFWSGKNPKVAINGSFLAIGESIQGWTISAIDQENRTVIVTRNGIKKTLRN